MKFMDSWKDVKEPLMGLLSKDISVLEDLSQEKALDVYLQYLSENWIHLVSSLSPVAMGLFLRAFTKGVLDVEPILKSSESGAARSGIEELQSKGLGVLRMSAKYLKISYKLYLYDEIRDFFSQNEKIRVFEAFRESFKSIDFTMERVQPQGVSYELFQFYFSYGFYVPWGLLDQNFDASTVELLESTGNIRPVFFILAPEKLEETQGFLCTHLEIPYELDGKLDIKSSESLQTRVFNDIAKLVFQIQKDGIKITKKGEMNRKTFDKLRKIVPDEPLLWFLLQFLKTRHYFESIGEELYKVSESFFPFFRHSLVETYEKLLETDDFARKIFQIFKGNGGLNLSLADVLLQYFKIYPDELLDYIQNRKLRRAILQGVELLFRVGLVDRLFTKAGMAAYRLSDLYSNAKNHHILPSAVLTISKSFQIVVDTTNKGISSQILYLLSIFGDVESSFPTCVFQVTQQTVHRALYFGFQAKEFIDILVLYGKVAPDGYLMQTLAHWDESYKVGILEEAILLHAAPRILDELEHKPEYAPFIKKRLSPEYAVVTQGLQAQKILEDSSLFFFPSSRIKGS